ncbi:MAG: YraN family protein [Bacteroidales bacterium]|nr:YraN family protein [Bacteroidales bacterium]
MENVKGDLGRKGEEVVMNFLIGEGMRVVARNWRSGHKELDLVMDDGEYLRVVEVKSLKYPNRGNPFENVDKGKRRLIIAAAQHFVMRYNIGKEVVFDVASVLFNGDFYKIEYFREAFSPCCI